MPEPVHAARVSVVMPCFDQARFVPRALDSLLAQSLRTWELIVVDDGSRDETAAVLGPWLADARVRLLREPENVGLGAALNRGLDAASAPLVAYLPCDDLWYPEHLQALVECMDQHPAAPAAFSGVRHHYNRWCEGRIDGYPLQLVQVIHRRVAARWTERAELTTDDLSRMYWSKLGREEDFAATGRVSCEWVDHPEQRHKRIREPVGGINAYRQRHRVREPLRFHSGTGHRIDEVAQYAHLRSRPDTPPAFDRLKILLVGELGCNAERVLALEELGHRLYGLWMREPHWYNTVGPLPFGHVEDLPWPGWREAVKRIKPDVIYALLNWQAVPFALEVLRTNPGVPFVWHFKEGPFVCMENGTWPALMELYAGVDGQIFCSPEMRDWFDTLGLASMSAAPRLVLDGDLPKREWFVADPAPRLSACDGEIHTVVPGRPIGLHPPDVGALAAQGVHLHVYGEFARGPWGEWIRRAREQAPRHLHLHPHVDPRRWVSEFSRYDAGWLHFFESRNRGDIRRADWDDLNLPARLGAFAAAGLPLLQRDNAGSIVATQTLAREHGIGLFFEDMEELAARLRDGLSLEDIRSNMRLARRLFTFDHHAAGLVAFFRQVIEQASARRPRPRAVG